jgi:DNA helicase-2/ATP-dependent DNA helicase PcrA
VKPVELLRTIPEVRERYRARFPVVLVDEYQDTNHAQYVLLQELVRGTGARTCSWWATTTSPSTAGAAPTCATSSTSRRISRRRAL